MRFSIIVINAKMGNHFVIARKISQKMSITLTVVANTDYLRKACLLLQKLNNYQYKESFMGDMGDIYRSMKEDRKERRKKYGVNCPECNIKQPKRIPSILLPGQKCKVCGYRDKRRSSRNT